jgi:glutaredoxin-related protein
MESVMVEIIESARNLKQLVRTQRKQGEHDAAAKTLQQGIDRLEGAFTRSPGELDKLGAASEPRDDWESAIAAELADLYGMLGGTLRERGDLVAAAAAYDTGFRYESNPRYRLVSSYNALNRLLTRIFFCPNSLNDPESLRKEKKLEFVDVRQSLIELQTQLKSQVNGVRSNDFWAAGDLALTSALNGDEQGVREALEQFASASPPPSAYSAYRDSIDSLAQLDTPRKETLIKAKAWLEKR